MTIIFILVGSVAAILFEWFAMRAFASKRRIRGWILSVLALICAIIALRSLPLYLIFIIAAVVCTLLAIWAFRLKRRLTGAVFAVFALIFALGALKTLQVNKMMATKMEMPAATVTSALVSEEEWPPTYSAVGSVSAVQGSPVATELDGTVAEIHFQNGGLAKKGDLLIKLDTSAEDGQMKTAQADMELARRDLDRSRDLANRKVISAAELDAADSKFKQKQGVVDNMRSQIEKKSVRASYDGQLGIRQVNVGQMIKAGQVVVPLQTLDPVFVDFSLPQQRLPNLQAGLEVHVKSDVIPGRDFVGKVTAVNSSVETATRNFSVQATLPNEDHALRPGMFVKVQVVMPEKQRTLVVPGTAVSYAPYGDSVFVIEKKKDEKTGQESQSLRQQFVRVGESRGDLVAVTKGLKAGEKVANGVLEPGQAVVSAGVFKLRNGAAVTVNNDLAPKPQLNPTPPDS